MTVVSRQAHTQCSCIRAAAMNTTTKMQKYGRSRTQTDNYAPFPTRSPHSPRHNPTTQTQENMFRPNTQMLPLVLITNVSFLTCPSSRAIVLLFRVLDRSLQGTRSTRPKASGRHTSQRSVPGRWTRISPFCSRLGTRPDPSSLGGGEATAIRDVKVG